MKQSHEKMGYLCLQSSFTETQASVSPPASWGTSWVFPGPPDPVPSDICEYWGAVGVAGVPSTEVPDLRGGGPSSSGTV